MFSKREKILMVTLAVSGAGHVIALVDEIIKTRKREKLKKETLKELDAFVSELISLLPEEPKSCIDWDIELENLNKKNEES